MKPKYVLVHAPHLGPGVRPIDSPPSPPKIYQYTPENYGPGLWEKLHRRAISTTKDDTDWLARFSRSVPCGVCRKHWNKMLAENPVDWWRYFEWTVDRHNDVNAKLGKQIMSLDEALSRWSQN